MAVPDFQSLMLPILKFAADGNEHSLQATREALANRLGLSQEDLDERLPSGRQTTFANRVAWAKAYLTQAGVLESPKRGMFHISDRGRKVLAESPDRIDIKYLERFPEFQEFRQASNKNRTDKVTQTNDKETSPTTPEETLEQAYQQLRDEVANELLHLINGNSPEFFERLVVHLLVAMGYGGSVKEAGKATRKTADEGIDGVIKEDRLGLDAIYLQAKRWEAVVGRPEIQKFVGALHGQRAKKGVFITTSRFSREALDYVGQIDPKVVLIDGADLVQLMIDHGVGVSSAAVYEVRKVDTDFFIEE
ncbi:restriction endonuclease [Desulfococcus multivorans]|uniref:Restriction endonuclease n=1 Tax=Desulfococcus multivorans DSM 2059 TaxID=1121405 RepID=S7U250_DESML|nr:restriction endonuclease [Desulfococcus multivorans]AOY57207.1 restriction endonuclease, type IV-like [Desulfococcus multivorans]AQV02832.1 restriction endonuclease [Desulfococcus multivorans]EPR43402.1 restriction endonuclease [Desulfococcus multivorans DSM 2059]SKA25725.1 restriction system protein [Desulfococcus multivorans DSM 2059]